MGLLKILLGVFILAAVAYLLYRWKTRRESEKMESNVKVLESQIESELEQKPEPSAEIGDS